MMRTLHPTVVFGNTPQGFPISARPRFNSGMDLPAIRRKNLRLIIQDRFHGNATAFSRVIERSQSQVSDMLTGRKAFGDKAARYIEEKLSLDRYDLDQAAMRARDPVLVRMIDDISRLNARNLHVLRVMLDGLLAGQSGYEDEGMRTSDGNGPPDRVVTRQ